MSTPATDLFALHAQNNPDRPAVIEGDDVFTFAQVNGEVNRLVGGLTALGFKPGDRMVWCGPNSREVLVTIHAGRKLGLVSVPLSYRFNAEEMHYIIDNSEAALVVVDAEQAWPLAIGLSAAYILSRGIAKSGARRGEERDFGRYESVH